MTDWKEVIGSQAEKPKEFDTTASSLVVYQRRNIKEVTEDEVTHWEYEERTLTKEEFNETYVNSLSEQLEQTRADIDFLSAMTGTDL